MITVATAFEVVPDTDWTIAWTVTELYRLCSISSSSPNMAGALDSEIVISSPANTGFSYVSVISRIKRSPFLTLFGVNYARAKWENLSLYVLLENYSRGNLA